MTSGSSGSSTEQAGEHATQAPGQMRTQVWKTLRLLSPVTVATDLVQSADDLSETHLIDRIAVHTEIAARQHPQIAGRQVGSNRITDERVRSVYWLTRGDAVPELFLSHLKLQRPDRQLPLGAK